MYVIPEMNAMSSPTIIWVALPASKKMGGPMSINLRSVSKTSNQAAFTP